MGSILYKHVFVRVWFLYNSRTYNYYFVSKIVDICNMLFFFFFLFVCLFVCFLNIWYLSFVPMIYVRIQALYTRLNIYLP